MTAQFKKRDPLYLVPVALFLVLICRFWHPVYGFTSFLMIDEDTPLTRIPEVHEVPVYIYPHGSYDGQYYAQLAYHPLLNSPELAPAMDSYAYRARRILPSIVAWLLAGGRPFLIFGAYSIVNILAWLALSVVLWDLLEVRDFRTWIAWFGVLFSAGAMFSVRRALTDLVALSFIAGALLLATRRRRVASAFSLSAAALCRETALFAAVDFFRPASQVGETKGRTSSFLGAMRLCMVAVAPLFVWALYVRYRVGPAQHQWGNFTWPFFGLVGQWAASLRQIMDTNDMILSVTSILALLGLTVQAVYFAVTIERENRWWRLGAAYVALMAFLSSQVWEGLPGAACRVLLPMTLAFNLLVTQRRATLAWLLMGNLSVFSGFLFVRDVEHDDSELVTQNSNSDAGIITQGPGWYGWEKSSSHLWLWSPQSAELGIAYWPQSSPSVGLQFITRTIKPAVVTLTSGEKVLWSHLVGKDPMLVSVAVPLSHGRATVAFASAGKPSSIPGDGRLLNFEVYDPKIVLRGTP